MQLKQAVDSGYKLFLVHEVPSPRLNADRKFKPVLESPDAFSLICVEQRKAAAVCLFRVSAVNLG